MLSYSNSVDARPQELTSYLSEPIKNEDLVQTFNHTLEKDEYLNEISLMLKKHPFDYSSAFSDELKARLEKFTISPSTLNKYLECPRAFLYSTVLNIPIYDKDNSNAHFGSAIHRTLQWCVNYAKENGRYPDKQQVLSGFDKNLSIEQFDSQETREMFMNRGVKSIDKYYKQMLETPFERIIATEYSFDFVPFGDNFLKGFIDRIEKNADETVEVYDYKTGSAKPKSQIADGKDYENYLNQLRFYKYAYEIQNQNTKVSRAGLIFVEEPDSNFYADLTDDDNKNIKEKIDFVYKNISELNFNAVPISLKTSKDKVAGTLRTIP